MGIVRARDDSCNNACAGKARSSGTRCRDVIFETLFETLWVSNPIRPRSATSRNRVMRGPGVTQGAKRSQGVRRPRVIEPRNALVARADVLRWTEGYIAASERPWRRGPCRGRSAWHACGWVSREPGRPHRLHLKGCRGGGAGTGSPSPRPWTWRLAFNGAKPQVLGWYRRAKATKRGGMGDEESERPIVPAKRGNRANETPWREGGADGWTRWRDRWPTRRGWIPSQRNDNG